MAFSTAARQQMRLQLVVLLFMRSLQVSHVLTVGEKKKKKLQSIPIKVSSGLSEILCICNSGKVKHGSCSLENSELYYFSQRFPFSSLAVTPLNGSMHSILSAGVEGQVCLLLMLGILSLQFVLGHFNSCN